MACFPLVMTYLPQARNPHKGAGDYELAAARGLGCTNQLPCAEGCKNLTRGFSLKQSQTSRLSLTMESDHPVQERILLHVCG